MVVVFLQESVAWCGLVLCGVYFCPLIVIELVKQVLGSGGGCVGALTFLSSFSLAVCCLLSLLLLLVVVVVEMNAVFLMFFLSSVVDFMVMVVC